jgi:3-oxoacyl-[acyl-carrier-protein] synthase-1
MRAGIDGFTETDYVDKEGDPIVGACVRCIASDLQPTARLVELLTFAITDALQRLPKPLGFDNCPILLCGRDKSQDVLYLVAERLSFTIRRDLLQVVTGEQTAVFVALQRARELLMGQGYEGCFIIGIDSLLRARALLDLERSHRLKTANNSDGIIPGEAAGVLLVTRKAAMSTSCALLGLGFAEETATVLNDEPLLGHGMAMAVRRALAGTGIEMHQVSLRISDVAGESYAFAEISLALSRVLRHRIEELPIWHAGDKIGDCGAAAGLVQLAVAEHAFQHNYAPGSIVMCHGGSGAGSRAVALVRR